MIIRSIIIYLVAIIILAINGCSFTDENRASIDWTSFSFEKLENELNKGNVVFIKFGADWCATCIFFEQRLETQSIKQYAEKHDIVMMYADFTERDEKLEKFMSSLVGNPQIPMLAIFYPENSHHPIVFGVGGYSTKSVLQKMKSVTQ